MRNPSQLFSSSAPDVTTINTTTCNGNCHHNTTAVVPDLIVRNCPVDDCSKCAVVYVNKLTGHRIVCRCPCHHERHKNIGLQDASSVGSDERLADVDSSPFVKDNSLPHPGPTKDGSTISSEENVIPVR